MLDLRKAQRLVPASHIKKTDVNNKERIEGKEDHKQCYYTPQ